MSIDLHKNAKQSKNTKFMFLSVHIHEFMLFYSYLYVFYLSFLSNPQMYIYALICKKPCTPEAIWQKFIQDNDHLIHH